MGKENSKEVSTPGPIVDIMSQKCCNDSFSCLQIKAISMYLLNKVLEHRLKIRECELKKIEEVSMNKLTGCDKHRKLVVRENE